MKKHFPILLTIVLLAGCMSIVQKQAREKLTNKDIAFSGEAFFAQLDEGNTDTVDLLLKAGIDPNIKNQFGETAFTRELKSSEPLLDTLKLLVKHGADINYTDHETPPPICIAFPNYNVFEPVEKEWQEIFDYFVDLPGIDIDKKDHLGYTALTHACDSGKIEIIKALLEKGADPNTMSKHGTFPLYEVASNHFDSYIDYNKVLDIVRLLIKHGADPNLKCGKNTTPIPECCGKVYFWENRIPLNEAVSSSHKLVMIKLLVESGAKVNEIDRNGATPLMYAVTSYPDNKVARYLIEQGADVNIQLQDKFTPLMLAVNSYYKDPGTVKLLLDNKCSVNTVNPLGDTCLDNAIELRQNLEEKKKELEKSPFPETKEELDLVKKDIMKYTEMIQLLRKHDAKTAKELKPN